MIKPRLSAGGAVGNGQLTAILASILLVLLAIEGATLFHVASLLTVHVFIGILLLPVVLAKLASTSWRMLRYYLGGEEYVRRGPPHPALRLLIAPLLVLSTAMLFGTGIALLVLGSTSGVIVSLHQASFVVWLGVMGAHVLAHVLKLPQLLRARSPGVMVRIAAATGAVVVGLSLAVATLPAADALQDGATARIGLDAR